MMTWNQKQNMMEHLMAIERIGNALDGEDREGGASAICAHRVIAAHAQSLCPGSRRTNVAASPSRGLGLGGKGGVPLSTCAHQ